MLEPSAKTADAKLSAAQRKMLVAAAATMKDTSLTPEDRLAAATSEPVAQLHLTNPLRDGVSPSQPQRFLVQRPESSFAAWYQFFPRSEGAYVDPETGKIKRPKPILPSEWLETFGLSVDEHRASTEIDLTEGFVSSDLTDSEPAAEQLPITSDTTEVL